MLTGDRKMCPGGGGAGSGVVAAAGGGWGSTASRDRFGGSDRNFLQLVVMVA